jgi:hypothetical protein
MRFRTSPHAVLWVSKYQILEPNIYILEILNRLCTTKTRGKGKTKNKKTHAVSSYVTLLRPAIDSETFLECEPVQHSSIAPEVESKS